MIHYNQLAKKFAKKKEGEEIMLRVSGMNPVGRYRQGHEKEGEPIPPQVENGALVKVTAVDVDAVTVATAEGKKVTFAHASGAGKLELTEFSGFPKQAV